jgi:hypothetical protein
MVPLAFMFGRTLEIGNELTVWIPESIRIPIIRDISNHLLELGNQLVIRVRTENFKESTTSKERICLFKTSITIGRTGLGTDGTAQIPNIHGIG